MKIIKCLVLFVFVNPFNVLAFDLEVDVLGNNYQPVSILISDFYIDSKSKEVSKFIQKSIARNLDHSGVFDTRFSQEKIIDTNINFETGLKDLDLYYYNHYQNIVLGKVIYSEEKKYYQVEIVILNSNGRIMRRIRYKLDRYYRKKEIYSLANDISNEIYETSLDLSGYFTSSLLFASGNKLIMSDYDGENQEVLIESKGKIMSPSFSNNGKMVIYVDFIEGMSRIYVYDLFFKKRINVASLQGLSLSPVFSNDDKKIIFSVSNEGQTHIYEASLHNKKLSKLTSGYSINIPGNYSYNGNLLVFNSDRSGTPKIYTLDLETKESKRISRGAGSYYNPSFSANSNLILFTKIDNQRFRLGLLSLVGKEKIVASDSLVESPSWLVDGRHIIYQYAYARSINGGHLYSFYIMDLLSGYKFYIKPAKDAQDPYISNGALPTKKISAKNYF